MSEYIIEIDSLTKIYKTGKTEFKALNNVSLRIRKGDFVAMVGTVRFGEKHSYEHHRMSGPPDGRTYHARWGEHLHALG